MSDGLKYLFNVGRRAMNIEYNPVNNMRELHYANHTDQSILAKYEQARKQYTRREYFNTKNQKFFGNSTE
jgi:hypothetical protein